MNLHEKNQRVANPKTFHTFLKHASLQDLVPSNSSYANKKEVKTIKTARERSKHIIDLSSFESEDFIFVKKVKTDVPYKPMTNSS